MGCVQRTQLNACVQARLFSVIHYNGGVMGSTQLRLVHVPQSSGSRTLCLQRTVSHLARRIAH